MNQMQTNLIENYKSKHRHSLNKRLHSIGIPMILLSLVIVFINGKWAVILFVVGWILQFIGHAIEGNQPAFLKNPIYLLIGPWWLIRRATSALKLGKSPISKSSAQ
jgi:uncharacterized membrane protein YGL010W